MFQQADNNMYKEFNKKELVNIIKKHGYINNIKFCKLYTKKRNQLLDIIDNYNINIYKLEDNTKFKRDFNNFINEFTYYDYGNNIHKYYKFRTFVNYFNRNDLIDYRVSK
jgi:spore coat protein CotF